MDDPEIVVRLCERCGEAMPMDADVCPHCGQIEPVGGPRPLERGVLMSTVLSILLAGLGQMYLGQYLRGAAILVIALLSGLLTIGIGYVLVCAWSAYDANRTARSMMDAGATWVGEG